MPTATAFQKLIIAALSAADSEAQADLQVKVPVFWSLYASKAAMPDLRYWYVYRETVKMLMGRNARKIDQTRRSSLSLGNQRNDVVSDGSTLAEATSESSELGNSSTVRGNTKTLTGLALSDSGESFSGTDQSYDDVNFYDIGSGSGSSTTRAHKNFTATRAHYSLNNALVKGTIDASDSLKKTVFTRMTDPIQGFKHAVSHTSTVILVASSTHNVTTDEGSAITQTDTTSEHIYNRVGGMKTDSDSDSVTDSTLTASRSFTANVFDGVSSHRSGAATGTVFGGDSNTQDSSGSGTMTHTSRHETRGLTISSTETHDLTTGTSLSLETSQANTLMLKLQQQYAHLKELFALATQQITAREKQAIPRQRHVFVVMTAQTPDSPGSDSNLQMNPCLPLLQLP